MGKSLFTIIISLSLVLTAQSQLKEELSIDEYLGYIKAFHPLVKQANIALSESEAKLLKSRGAFDPKLSADFNEKNFKGSNYYERLNATFSIPTYYGLTLNGQFSQAEGVLVNPENVVNGNQLYGVGASLNLAKGLLANERMTALKQAKSFVNQAREENALQINEILFEATKAYLDWYRAYREYEIYEEFIANALFRFEGVKSRFEVGDLAEIDTTEARIAYQSRLLSQEKAALKLREKALKASNFLWIGDTPVEITQGVIPSLNAEAFELIFTVNEIVLEEHPKLKALGYKADIQKFERRLQRSNLLPEVTLDYQWLSETDPSQNFNLALDPDNSTTKLKIAMPLFLRKERAELRLAELKFQDVTLEQDRMYVSLKNKIDALQTASVSYSRQRKLAESIVVDNTTLFSGEQQKFEAGESSLFLVNSRESKLIESTLKAIEIDIAQKAAQAEFYFNVNFPDLDPTTN